MTGIVRPCLHRPPGRGVSSLACGSDGYRKRCSADQCGQRSGNRSYIVLSVHQVSGSFCLTASIVLPRCLRPAMWDLFFLFRDQQGWLGSRIASKRSRLHTSGARTLFLAFNDSSRAQLYLDLERANGDSWAAAEIARRAFYEEWRLYSGAICNERHTRVHKRKRAISSWFLE